MKKSTFKLLYIALCVLCVLPNNLIAQVPQSVRNYFKENILSLDPIEGIYDAQTYLQGYNAFQVFPKEYKNMVMYIKKTGDNTYSLGSGAITFSRIGETNAYTLKIKWSAAPPTTLRVYLENNVRLNYEYEMPERQMRSDMGREYQNGMGIIAGFSLIKTYPTQSDYNEAYAKEAKRQAQQRAEEEQAAQAAKITEWTGTGFALNKGYIVTNYHVIEEAKSINVSGIQGNFNVSYNAFVVAKDKINDLAIIKIDDSKFKGFGPLPYSINMQMAEVGDDVYVLGYPLIQTMGDEIKLTNGIINARTGFEGDAALYQMSAPVQPGNSGGPMFDSKGNIIGIVCAKHTGADNVGYAIKTSYLKNLAETASLSNIFPTNNTIAALPLSGKVKKIKQYVYLIKCSSNPPIEENTNTHNYAQSNPESKKDYPSKPHVPIADGYVDLGLPSGTKWYSQNEQGLYSYDDAVNRFGEKLPNKEQLEELKTKCQWTWDSTNKGYTVTGPNGNSIFLPAASVRDCDGSVYDVGSFGYYWSSTPNGSGSAWYLYFYSGYVGMGSIDRCYGQSVRLVQDGDNKYPDADKPEEKYIPKGYVDLGLPSGTKWYSQNEQGLYSYDDAVNRFGEKLPTKEQLKELKTKCRWKWNSSSKGYTVIGPNGNSIFLPAAGYRYCSGSVGSVGSWGYYWSSTPGGSSDAWYLDFYSGNVSMFSGNRCDGQSVRLVQDGDNKYPDADKPEEKYIPKGYVDLGLPSGTYWKIQNEAGYYTYDDAVSTFGDKLPTKEQLEELKTKCRWKWDSSSKGYTVIGPNGNSIFLPAAGYRGCNGGVYCVGSRGYCWSSTPNGSSYAWYLNFYSGDVSMDDYNRCGGLSVRLVQD